MASPLLGYNTNVRHLGKLYHIQTEDSGASHGHIFTHLFADGGRIIASKKTTYAEYQASPERADIVKQLMRESHKAMFIALRDGLFDTDEAAGAQTMAEMEIRLPDALSPPAAPPVDVDALERAAEARLAQSAALHPSSAERSSTPPTYASTIPAASGTSSSGFVRAESGDDGASPSADAPVFGSQVLSEKSLDEVILSYLADDLTGQE